MADPKISVAKTLAHEGGFVNNLADSGGPTKYGITQKDLPNTPIETLTEEQATEYYLEHYVKPYYTQIENQDVLDKLFDSGVLFGIGSAVKVLQIVLALKDDGDFGPVTLAKVNDSEPVSLLNAFKTGLVTHAIAIASSRPQDRVFLRGWITRVNS